MRTLQEHNKLTLFPEGRIDTGNAAEAEREMTEAVNAAPGAELVIDAGRLEYISSAGLRVLMKLRKQAGKPLDVVNVSPEVYEIFETTGFTELLNVRKRLREISVEGCEKIGQGGDGAVYRLDADKIVKVYTPEKQMSDIERERSFARTAFVNGVPSVIAYDTVRVGDCLGVVFELLKSDTLGHAMRDNPDKLGEYVAQYVDLARTLHNTHMPKGSLSDIRDIQRGRLERLSAWCSPEEINTLKGIIDSIPERDTVIHNDLHPGNIMIQNGELVLIDMAEISVGPTVFDLSSIYRDMVVGARTNIATTESTIGMPVDMVEQVAQMFFAQYTGITDPRELKAYFDRLTLIFALNTVLFVGAGVAETERFAQHIMDNLLRPVVIPNEQAIRGLLQTM